MKIVAYHNNLYLDAFKLHCEEIKSKGFTHILFCIPEHVMLWSMDNIKAMKQHAEREGLKTIANPWGLAGIFGGEALSSVNYIDEGSKALKLFDTWARVVREAGFSTIMLDEPKGYFDFLIAHVSGFFKVIIVFSDDIFWNVSDQLIQSLAVQSVGVSCYHWIDDKEKVKLRTGNICQRLTDLRPLDNHLWIQGFDLPKKREWIPALVKSTAEEYGINDFGYWSFRASEATSEKRPDNYEKVWNEINF